MGASTSRILYLAVADGRGHLMRAHLLRGLLAPRGLAVEIVTTSIEGQDFLAGLGTPSTLLSEGFRIAFDDQHRMLPGRTELRLAGYIASPRGLRRDLRRLRGMAAGSALLVNDSLHPAALALGAIGPGPWEGPGPPATGLRAAKPRYAHANSARIPVVNVFGENLWQAALRNFDGRLPGWAAHGYRRLLAALDERAFGRIVHSLACADRRGLTEGPTRWRLPPLVAPPQRSRAAVRRDIGRRDELGDLADAFNTVLLALGERNRTNEAFLADLAHEFKNPVAAIRASAERLRDGGNADPARLERLAEVLQRSAARLEALLAQLLELARAEAGLPNESRERFDVGALLRGLCGALEADPRWSHLRVRLEAPVSPVEVTGVPDRIEGALRNLLDNAASFARHVRLELRADRLTVELRVGDDGPGIAAEDLPRVFERFFTTRQDRRGTGLGLSLARAVIEAHGGRVEASSPPGQGATFVVTLPGAAPGP